MMSNLEKYQGQQVVQDLIRFDGPIESESDSAYKLIKPILRHWRIVLVTFVAVCTIGIPAVWYRIKSAIELYGSTIWGRSDCVCSFIMVFKKRG